MFLLRRSFWGPGPQKVHHDVSDMDVLFESLDFQGYLFYIHPRDVQASKVWCRTRRPRRRQRRRALGHSRNTAHKVHRATRTGRTWEMQHRYPENPHHLGKTWGLLYIYIINIHNRFHHHHQQQQQSETSPSRQLRGATKRSIIRGQRVGSPAVAKGKRSSTNCVPIWPQ